LVTLWDTEEAEALTDEVEALEESGSARQLVTELPRIVTLPATYCQ
jgi:hypothetical protein